MQQFTGLQYLQIDIANQMSNSDVKGVKLDKSQFEDRIAWVQKYEADLEDLVDLADKPFQYIAAVMAYRDAQMGRATGHLVGVDAAASGLQFFAALTGCQTTARNTGLIGDRCTDIYGVCTTEMSMLLGSKVDIPRGPVKSALMTKFYGSKQKPKDVFGEGTEEYQAFHEASHNVAPGACELLEIFLGSWQAYTLSHSWKLPDGFTVIVPVMVQTDSKIEVDELDHASFTYRHEINCGTETGLSLAANTIHSIDGMMVRELSRRCNYDEEKLIECMNIIHDYVMNNDEEICEHPQIEQLAHTSQFYSLVGVEHITHNNVNQFSHEYLERLYDLIERTLCNKSFPVISIHDEFKAHPNNINRVRQCYAEIMAEIAESNMLSHLLTQIRGEYFEVQKYSENLGDLIREGHYAVS
jgi:hypothetical protein